jgi:hypothetical protein
VVLLTFLFVEPGPRQGRSVGQISCICFGAPKNVKLCTELVLHVESRKIIHLVVKSDKNYLLIDFITKNL